MRVKWLLVLTLCFSLWTCSSPETAHVRVMSFNIRLDLPSDGQNAWPHRKDQAASMIQFYEPDLVGLQEALLGQVQDLAQRLPAYDWIGVGRDDGGEKGEFMAVFYNKDRFQILKHDTFWLSETPEFPSKGWDAAWIRVVTWARFQDRWTGHEFYHFNTHFDNRGEIARRSSAKLLLQRMENIAGAQDVIVTGDFNSNPNSETYRILTAENPEPTHPQLYNSMQRSELPHHGPTRTFTGFQLDSLSRKGKPIDFIFVNNSWRVLKHATLSDSFEGYLPSDHLPVLAELAYQK